MFTSRQSNGISKIISWSLDLSLALSHSFDSTIMQMLDAVILSVTCKSLDHVSMRALAESSEEGARASGSLNPQATIFYGKFVFGGSFLLKIFDILLTTRTSTKPVREVPSSSADSELSSFLQAFNSFVSFLFANLYRLSRQTAKMGALKYVEELQKKKQSDVVAFLLRVRCWEVR